MPKVRYGKAEQNMLDSSCKNEEKHEHFMPLSVQEVRAFVSA